ncbi:SpaA isopeptide-forming pilin-related protein [Clostridium perfringens]|nr:SpaA isopeptide-forming pilin-related protein [Clostridium perfringens]
MFFNILLSSFYPITVYAKNEYEYWGYTTNAPDGGPNSTNNEAYYMTNGSETKRVFCINRNAAAPWGYDFDSSKRFGDIYREVSGTQSELLKGVNGNKYGDKLEENVRKVFYYVSQNNLTTLTSNKLIWEVTGSDMGLTDEEQNLFTSIINGPEAPGNFVLDLYQPKKSDMQVLARGYIDNTLKDIAISKQDLGGKELPGAKIEIKNEDGSKIIEKWTSSNQAKHIYLKPGNYIFHEEAAPNGYLKVTDIKFTVDNNGNVKVVSFGKDDKVVAEGNKLTVTDKDDTKEVIFSKQDLGGNELAGATIELKKADGTVIETWKSDGKAHSFQLVAGDYIFHESAAPEGYEVATDITFTVKNDGTVTSNDVKVSGDSNNHIVMVDGYSPREIIISKQDLGGNELPGAEIQIKNEAGDTVVEKWTSSDQEKHISLKPGNYIFHEEAAPNGYIKVTDITFTVDNNGNVKVVSFGKDDKVVAEGNKLTVTDKDDTKEVIFSKQDLGGNELAGATIELKKADGTVIETWKSDGKAHSFQLVAGDYIFHESAAPEGYEVATDIAFTVKNDGTVTSNDVKVSGDSNNHIVMVDGYSPREIIISKQDLGGNELPGAEIQIKNEAGDTVLETWTSSDQEKHISLKPGNYIFHEEAAPNGYLKVTDIHFKVTTDGKVQVIKKSAADKVTAVDNKLTVVDKNKIKIPNTGDNFLITTILAGAFLLILSCSWFKKRYA